jgi:hypothetical protein
LNCIIYFVHTPWRCELSVTDRHQLSSS